MSPLLGRAWIGAALCSLLVGAVGCASAPRSDEALRDIDAHIEDLDRQWDAAKELCNGDPECEARVRDEFLALKARASELRLDVIEEDWQRARRERLGQPGG